MYLVYLDLICNGITLLHLREQNKLSNICGFRPLKFITYINSYKNTFLQRILRDWLFHFLRKVIQKNQSQLFYKYAYYAPNFCFLF